MRTRSILCTDDLCSNFCSLPLPSKIGVHEGHDELSYRLELTLHPRTEKYPESILASTKLDFTVLIWSPQKKPFPRNVCPFHV